MSVALSGLSTWKGPLPFGLETDRECYVSLIKVITAFHTPNYIVFDFGFNFTLAAELVTTHGDGYEFYYAFHCMPFVGTSRLRLP